MSNLAWLDTTCAIYRPFGAGSPTAQGVKCKLYNRFSSGRGYSAGPNYITWSHYLEVDDSVDVRDGCSRTVGSDLIAYGDGDEIRVPDINGSRYVVVWVERWNLAQTGMKFKRVYLLRHSAVWPGP